MGHQRAIMEIVNQMDVYNCIGIHLFVDRHVVYARHRPKCLNGNIFSLGYNDMFVFLFDRAKEIMSRRQRVCRLHVYWRKLVFKICNDIKKMLYNIVYG